MERHKLLVVTDLQAVPLLTVLDAIRVVRKDGVEQLDPLIIAQASADCLMWTDSSSIDDVVCVCKSSEFPRNHLRGSITRVLKPGGTILLYLVPYKGQMMDSSLEHKLLQHGYLDIQSSGSQPFWVMGKKPSSEIGSPLSIKNTSQVLPKVQVDDDMNLIDEEDIKKPRPPSGSI